MGNSTHPESRRNVTLASLAERLAPFIDDEGDPVHAEDSRTVAGVQQMAAMLADVAARLAAIDPATLPEGFKLSAVLSFQPDFRDTEVGYDPATVETAAVSAINAVATQLTPGIPPKRVLMEHSPGLGTVHYRNSARVGGGMGYTFFDSVAPTEVEAATMLRLQTERAHRMRTERPAGTESSVRVAVCSCGEYRSTPGTHDEVTRRHAQHRGVAVRRTLALAVSQALPDWYRVRRASAGSPDCAQCPYRVPAGAVNRVAALAVHLVVKHTPRPALRDCARCDWTVPPGTSNPRAERTRHGREAHSNGGRS